MRRITQSKVRLVFWSKVGDVVTRSTKYSISASIHPKRLVFKAAMVRAKTLHKLYPPLTRREYAQIKRKNFKNKVVGARRLVKKVKGFEYEFWESFMEPKGWGCKKASVLGQQIWRQRSGTFGAENAARGIGKYGGLKMPRKKHKNNRSSRSVHSLELKVRCHDGLNAAPRGATLGTQFKQTIIYL